MICSPPPTTTLLAFSFFASGWAESDWILCDGSAEGILRSLLEFSFFVFHEMAGGRAFSWHYSSVSFFLVWDPSPLSQNPPVAAKEGGRLEKG